MSDGGLRRRLPCSPPSFRSTSTSASPGSVSSYSSSSSDTAKVADNFTFPAASSTTTPEALPDPDAADDACSATPGGDVVAFELEISAAATARPTAFFWVMVRVAVLASTLAAVVSADVAFALHLFAHRRTT